MAELWSITLPPTQGETLKVTVWDQIFGIIIRHCNVIHKYEHTFVNMVVSLRPIWTHSAIIEHTNKVLYMEDDDIAVVKGGKLSIHRLNRRAGEDPVRAIQTLQMELQQIMKGQIKKSKRRFCYPVDMYMFILL